MIEETYREFNIYEKPCIPTFPSHNIPKREIIAIRESEFLEKIPFDEALRQGKVDIYYDILNPPKFVHEIKHKTEKFIFHTDKPNMHLIKKLMDLRIDGKKITKKQEQEAKQFIYDWEFSWDIN